MSLKSLTYTEFLNAPPEWTLEKCDFSQINLVVGRNATGKTRLINVINGLCMILNGKQSIPFQSGTYKVEIVLSGKTYILSIEFADGYVVKEWLDVDGVRRLTRGPDGKGNIYYEQEKKSIKFEVPKTAIAIQLRQDALQHPFVVELSKWAMGCQAYFFGSALGKDTVVRLTDLQLAGGQPQRPGEAEDLVRIYAAAYQKYKKRFDTAVLRDMKSLGYDLTDVGSDDMRRHIPGLKVAEPLLGIFVTERDRNVPLPQMQMSQGMFRALALVIHINAASFSKQRTLVLIDDIGEGLDYERSASLIDVVTRHATKTGLQLIMTSNDRFVMNRVPLEHWSLLRRTGTVVRAYTQRNSAKEFEEFKYMGLSNFDLLTSEIFQ